MTKIYSLNSDVKFPDMEHYDMGKASDMALYLAHCDFYPFRSVIENNKIALDAIDESYRNLAEEARLKNDFFTEQWAMTSGTLHSCRVDLLTQYSLLLTMVSLLEEAVNTLCRLYHNINHLDKEVKDIKGSGLERAAKYLKDVVGIDGFTADKQWEYITVIRDARNMVVHLSIMVEEYIKNSINTINLKLSTEKRTTNFIWNITTSLRCMMLFLILWIELLGLFHKVNEK